MPAAQDEFRHALVPNHPARAFSGTADYYSRFRPRYPRRLLDPLRWRTGIDGTGRLLDLACGTGEVAFALCQDFREIWAIDLEPEMVATARRKAEDNDVVTIKWLVGRAEEVDAPPGYFDMITAGRAFHRLSKAVIADCALRWLRPGGYFVDLGIDSGVISGHDEEWQRVAHAVFEDWTRPARDQEDQPPQNAVPASASMVTTIEVLQAAGFTELEELRVWTPFTWTPEELTGYYFSLSVSSRALLGDRADDFARDLTDKLLAYDPSGRYTELMRGYYILGRAPQ